MTHGCFTRSLDLILGRDIRLGGCVNGYFFSSQEVSDTEPKLSGCFMDIILMTIIAYNCISEFASSLEP